ncbi:LLM class flavin-dependent oxidoreductase [Janthinobacterium sp. 17J80-10]|uniref:LLM class flavin-dependent oxidoreductase n=1 Tax=Janthinobacterium sp. 17J80-10 TaxID=2497863 RepID=UPI001005A740|nr:LLM class flavin-dependent oxidoreductase [Janthinobacterium sp. 17J80-10]QAU33981.1 LLM class flavin-dependent oxidoreductase [Janthinobacterium sp. 17J80-10]
MGIEVFWQLPVHGDGRAISPELWNRGDYSARRKEPHPYARTGVQRDGYTFYDHLSQIAGAADLARFDGVWIPFTAAGEDPLITAGAFVREARHLKFVPALRAPLLSAVYATKIANSFQRLSGGRLIWNLVTEEDQPRTWHGRHWSVEEQIERTGEFLDVAKGFWHDAPFTYKGKYFEVENGGFAPALQGPKFPQVYLSGESEAAYALSARHADVHILPLLPPEELKPRIARLNELAATHGRTVRFAVEADIVARQTADEAWGDLLVRWTEATANPVVPISANAAVNVKPPLFDELVAGKNLWSGFGLVRPGASAGLVGSYDDLVERVREYLDIGVDSFIFAANPALEEAYRLSEKLLPRLRALNTVGQAKAA